MLVGRLTESTTLRSLSLRTGALGSGSHQGRKTAQGRRQDLRLRDGHKTLCPLGTLTRNYHVTGTVLKPDAQSLGWRDGLLDKRDSSPVAELSTASLSIEHC